MEANLTVNHELDASDNLIWAVFNELITKGSKNLLKYV